MVAACFPRYHLPSCVFRLSPPTYVSSTVEEGLEVYQSSPIFLGYPPPSALPGFLAERMTLCKFATISRFVDVAVMDLFV